MLCVICGEEFVAKRHDVKVCSQPCRDERKREQVREWFRAWRTDPAVRERERERNRERNREYRADPAVRERERERVREWRADPTSRERERKRDRKRRDTPEYREWHREQSREYCAKLRANPETRIILYAKKAAASPHRRSPPWQTPEDRDAIKAIYLKAKRETERTGVKHAVDHYFPINPSSGQCIGLHVPGNLRVVKATTNGSKSNHLPPGDPADFLKRGEVALREHKDAKGNIDWQPYIGLRDGSHIIRDDRAGLRIVKAIKVRKAPRPSAPRRSIPAPRCTEAASA